MVMGVIDHHQQPHPELNGIIGPDPKRTRVTMGGSNTQATLEDDFVCVAPFNNHVDATRPQSRQKPGLDVCLVIETFLVEIKVGK